MSAYSLNNLPTLVWFLFKNINFLLEGKKSKLWSMTSMLKHMMTPKFKNHVPLRMAAQVVIRREIEEVTASDIYSLRACFPSTFSFLKQKQGKACPKVMKSPNAPPVVIPQRKCLLWWKPQLKQLRQSSIAIGLEDSEEREG